MKLDIKGFAILAAIAAVLAFFLLSPGQGLKAMPTGLQVQTMEGQPLNLDSLKGKPYLLTFWSTTCPGCVGEIPVLQAMQQKMQDKGFKIIAIAMPYDKAPAIQAMMTQKGMNYIVGHDASGNLVKQFDIRVTPTSFLVDAQGNIAVQRLGEWKPEDLEAKINDLLKG